MIGTSATRHRARARVKPSVVGSITSRITRSGRKVCNVATARSPSNSHVKDIASGTESDHHRVSDGLLVLDHQHSCRVIHADRSGCRRHRSKPEDRPNLRVGLPVLATLHAGVSCAIRTSRCCSLALTSPGLERLTRVEGDAVHPRVAEDVHGRGVTWAGHRSGVAGGACHRDAGATRIPIAPQAGPAGAAWPLLGASGGSQRRELRSDWWGRSPVRESAVCSCATGNCRSSMACRPRARSWPVHPEATSATGRMASPR